MRRVRELEFLVGAGFLLGPMIYVLTLSSHGFESCEKPAPALVESHSGMPALVEAPECPPDEVEVEPTTPTIAAPTEPSFAPQPFMFVYGNAVILHDDAPADWGVGELFEPRGEARYRAARSADLDRLPGDLAARVDRSIDLYGATGKLCTVEIERLTVVAQYDGWGMSEVLGSETDYDDLDDDGWPVGISREAVREMLWTKQPKWLIGELARDSDCKGASWARDPELPAPTILTESKRSNTTIRTRLREFRRSPELAAAEAGLAAYRAELDAESLEGIPTWETVVSEQPARARGWLDAEGETRVIELRFGYDEVDCGDSEAWPSLQKLEVLNEGEFEERMSSVDPIAVFDADLDGHFELLYGTSDEGWERWLDSVTDSLEDAIGVEADWACPC